MKKTFEYYIDQFIDGVSATVDVDYLERKSIQRNNNGVDQYRKAARNIDKYYLEYIEEFSQLLYSPLPRVNICCAVCLLELMHYNNKQESEAMNVIRKEMENMSSAEKLGWKDWIERWENHNIKTVYKLE